MLNLEENTTYFQKSVKAYLHTMRRHLKYLQASSKCKHFIFQKILQNLTFLMPFCIQNDQTQKSQKIAKIAFFLKQSIFSKRSSGHHRRSEMIPNSSPKCSKYISNQYSMFTSILDYFLKNRKESIFEKIFSTMHQQHWPN